MGDMSVSPIFCSCNANPCTCRSAVGEPTIKILDDPEPPVPPAQPHTCPVCQGRRYVPSTFYDPGYESTTAINSVPCQTCLGTGVLWR